MLNADNKKKLVEKCVYLEKNALTTLEKFLNSWAELEVYRYRYVNKFINTYKLYAVKFISNYVYKNYKEKYPKEILTPIPYPECE